MSKKQDSKYGPRKVSKTLTSSRRVRLLDAATYDSGKVRFGSGMAPAVLRK